RLVIYASINAKEAEQAEELLGVALVAYPDHGGIHQSHGHLLHDLRKRYDEAAQAYTRALRLTPDSPALLRNRSNSLRLAGHIEKCARPSADYSSDSGAARASPASSAAPWCRLVRLRRTASAGRGAGDRGSGECPH